DTDSRDRWRPPARRGAGRRPRAPHPAGPRTRPVAPARRGHGFAGARSASPPAARGLRPRAPASTLRETMAGPPDEHVLERRLPVGDRAHRIRKRVDQVADELVSAG